MAPLAAALAEEGFVTVSVEYRLAGDAIFPAPVEDIAAAVDWLRGASDSLGVDPSRIALLGGSAGAHLAALVALGAGEHEGQGGDEVRPWGAISAPVEALIALAIPADLIAMSDWAQEQGRFDVLLAGMQFLGVTDLEDTELARRASPITHVTSDDPRVFLLHGAADDLVPVAQSEALRDRLLEVGGGPVMETVPEAPHAFWHYNRWVDWVAARVAQFLREGFPEIGDTFEPGR